MPEAWRGRGPVLEPQESPRTASPVWTKALIPGGKELAEVEAAQLIKINDSVWSVP